MYFLELMTEFARKCNAVLVSAHSLSVVDPTRQQVLRHLCRWPGANAVLDRLFASPAPGKRTKNPSKVFLSHSSSDKAFVSRLANDLRGRRVPVWFDQWQLRVGDSLTRKIQDGIGESSYLAVVLSRHSIRSQWVQKELAAAQALELRRRNVFVLPIVIDDCRIPVFLLDKLHADFRISYEHGLASLIGRIVEGDDA